MSDDVGLDCHVQNNHGETALHCAAQYGHTRVVAALLSSGADAAVENTKFQTPLELAALYGRLETVKMLIKTHPELIEIYGGPGRFPSSPLHSASRNGHSEIVEALLDAGFPVSMATPAGTALHEAAAGGKLVIVRLLLARGVDARRRDARGHTAQHVLENLATPLARDITTLIRDRISSQSCEIPEN